MIFLDNLPFCRLLIKETSSINISKVRNIIIICLVAISPVKKTEIIDHRGSAALTTRHPSIGKSLH
jgi:hypothetical protein